MNKFSVFIYKIKNVGFLAPGAENTWILKINAEKNWKKIASFVKKLLKFDTIKNLMLILFQYISKLCSNLLSNPTGVSLALEIMILKNSKLFHGKKKIILKKYKISRGSLGPGLEKPTINDRNMTKTASFIKKATISDI